MEDGIETRGGKGTNLHLINALLGIGFSALSPFFGSNSIAYSFGNVAFGVLGVAAED